MLLLKVQLWAMVSESPQVLGKHAYFLTVSDSPIQHLKGKALEHVFEMNPWVILTHSRI